MQCSVVSPVLVLLLAHCIVNCGTWHVRLLQSTPLLRWCTHDLSHHCIFLACCCVATVQKVDSICCLLLLHLLRYSPFLFLALSFFLGLWLIHLSIVTNVHINGRRINSGIQRGVCGFWVLMINYPNIHITGEFLIVAINHWHKRVFGRYWEISATFPHSRLTCAMWSLRNFNLLSGNRLKISQYHPKTRLCQWLMAAIKNLPVK